MKCGIIWNELHAVTQHRHWHEKNAPTKQNTPRSSRRRRTVDDAKLVVDNARQARLVLGQRLNVADGDRLEEGHAVLAGDAQRAHVRDVEQRRVLARQRAHSHTATRVKVGAHTNVRAI